LDKDSNGTIDYTTTTDSNGYYTFTSLSSGTYVLSQVLQTGWRQVYPASNGTYTFSYSPYLNLTAKNFGNLYSGGNHRPVLDNSGAKTRPITKARWFPISSPAPAETASPTSTPAPRKESPSSRSTTATAPGSTA
jgi:hypothetical protein